MSFPVFDEPSRRRFVTLCQQLLALAVILAVLTPAARTVTMEVRPVPSGDSAGQVPEVRLRAAAAVVPTAVVDPVVKEYALTAPRGARIAPGSLRARITPRPTGGERILTEALPVRGYGALGVTWESGDAVDDHAIDLQARTRTAGRWSGWTTIEYHDDHGPDPDSREARRARPGTDPLLVGDVDRVQVRIATDDAAPRDLKVAVIDPGHAASSARQAPAIDTAALPGSAGAAATTAYSRTAGEARGAGELALAAATTTPKPQIFSRAQWGADERMRDKPSLRYHEVHAGFVHHTVNANDYTRAQVPAILRGIYAYHTRSRGWSDIGYNFLIDRFGRVWEGRYGGVDRPVVGAHTLGYNDDAFAASAIGNFDTVKPSRAMVRAYGRLLAWKLSLHGVDATSSRQWVASRYFPAINGHRDADATACPGRYLYAKLSRIRTLAGNAQAGWTGRELESDIVGSDLPDLVVRRASDGRGLVLPLVARTDGTLATGRPVDTGLDLSKARQLLKAGDWDRDGHVDLLERRKRQPGRLYLYRGDGDGTFAAPTVITSALKGVRLLAAVGDFTGDGYPDLMGQPRDGSMMIYPGAGDAGVRTPYAAYGAIDGQRQIGIGRWNSDGATDTLVLDDGRLEAWSGNGPGGLMSGKAYPTKMGGYDWLVGVSSLDADTHADLLARARKSKRLWYFPATGSGLERRVSLGLQPAYDLAG